MSAQTTKTEYMLLFRGNDWHKGLSPEEMQQVSDQWMAWFKRLTEQGKAIAGNPLEPKGKIVSGKNGRIAFVANLTGTNQIYTTKADGTDLFQVTNLPPANDPVPNPPVTGTMVFVDNIERLKLEPTQVMSIHALNPDRLTTVAEIKASLGRK